MGEIDVPMQRATRTIGLRFRESHVLAATGFLILPVAIFVPRALAVLFSASSLTVFVLAALNRRWPDVRAPFLLALAAFFLWGLLSASWSITPGESARTAVSLGATLLGGFVLVRAAGALDAAGKASVERALIAGGLFGYVLLFIDLATSAPIIMNKVFTLMNRPFMAPEAAIFFFNPGLAIASLFAWPWLLSVWKRAPLLAVAAVAGVMLIFGLGDADAPGAGLALGGVVFLATLVCPRAMVWAAAATVGIGVIAAPLLPKALLPSVELVREAPYLSNSAYHRLGIWQIVVQHVDKAPILGHGFDASRALYDEATKEERTFYDKEGRRRWVSQYEPIPLHPHNAVLQVWLELGGVGALLGLAILLSVILAIDRRGLSRLDRAVALGTFVTAIFIASISFGIWQSWWLCGLWLIGALTAAIMRRQESGAPGTRSAA